MLRSLGIVACVIALLVQVGAHWAVLQTIAWSTMWASYVQEMDAGEALIRAIDGKAPCTMCTEISQKKAEEKQENPALPRPKLDTAKEWCTVARTLPERSRHGTDIRWPARVDLVPDFLSFPPEEQPPQA